MSGWIKGVWKAGKEVFKKQKTTGTEVITSLKGKYNIKKKEKKSWKDHVDTSHPSYKKEYEGL
jgi:hypothetical protein